MPKSLISRAPLSQPWQALDPFLFAVHHQDHYPAGDGQLGLKPDQIAAAGKTYQMYHGEHVPGFPAHPHRGFETVTIVLKGLVDHADSLGGAARYGQGDVQWLTTGAGVEHGEMFPLVNTDGDNPLELFQIWLNLPPEGKSAPPAFNLFWAEDIPHVVRDGARVQVIAGDFEEVKPLTPPPHSWAASADHHLAIWLIDLEPGSGIDLPTAPEMALRRLYLFEGEASVDGELQPGSHLLNLDASRQTRLDNPTSAPARLLLLQAMPIEAPVFARGPFVMNTQTEMVETILDYQAKGYGQWPWPSQAHTHGDEGRFALYPDGKRLFPPKA